MSKPTDSTDSGYTTLSLSPELRDKIRMAKAEQGQSYDDYLKTHLPVGE